MWDSTSAPSEEALSRPAGSPAPVHLPIFPLRAVLFPGATVPLHIFEPRYREMVGRCLEHDEPFGVVLIQEGEEVGGHAAPRRIGTEARVIASQRYRDGRYDIVAEGRRRFEILQLDRSRAYLRADVEWLEELEGRDVHRLAETVATLFEGVLESLELAGHAIVDESWKALDPRSLSYRVAAALPADDLVKQELLEAADVASRLVREAELLMSVARIGAEAGAA